MVTVDERVIRDLVESIHDRPGRVMLVTAGAGTRALAWLLGVAGASRTLLEALTPYDESSFDDFLGRKPRKYVELRTAGLLAGRAVARARRLYRGQEPVIGLACTATIITDRPKRGQHRAHIAAWTAESVDRYSLYMHKGERDRRGEEEMVSLLIMNALARAYGLAVELPIRLLDKDRFSRVYFDLSGETRKLYSGTIEKFGIGADGRKLGRRNKSLAILSGAFNPLHEGHLALARTAEAVLDQEVVFELAAVNAGKPTLSVEQTQERLLQFAGRHTVIVSNAALFSLKADLFPGATFIVGVDTAERVLQSRYYDDDPDKMVEALGRIRQRGCRFLVAGRVDEKGHYRKATDIDIPSEFNLLFTPFPGDHFRIDISSTEVRAKGTVPSVISPDNLQI